ncbi:MAG: hypothetical protein KME30_32795 [Iphinoe sp. HA4291-MV1]|nr:hypothetical protein [Iphinoe sp. HA4291-MV1]
MMHLFGKLWADKHMLGVAIIQAEAMLMKAWAIAYLYEEQSKIHLRLMTLSHKTKAKPRQNWLSKLKPVTYKLLTDWAIEYSQLKTQ